MAPEAGQGGGTEAQAVSDALIASELTAWLHRNVVRSLPEVYRLLSM
jgi:hypothetical protein